MAFIQSRYSQGPIDDMPDVGPIGTFDPIERKANKRIRREKNKKGKELIIEPSYIIFISYLIIVNVTYALFSYINLDIKRDKELDIAILLFLTSLIFIGYYTHVTIRSRSGQNSFLAGFIVVLITVLIYAYLYIQKEFKLALIPLFVLFFVGVYLTKRYSNSSYLLFFIYLIFVFFFFYLTFGKRR